MHRDRRRRTPCLCSQDGLGFWLGDRRQPRVLSHRLWSGSWSHGQAEQGYYYFIAFYTLFLARDLRLYAMVSSLCSYLNIVQLCSIEWRRGISPQSMRRWAPWCASTPRTLQLDLRQGRSYSCSWPRCLSWASPAVSAAAVATSRALPELLPSFSSSSHGSKRNYSLHGVIKQLAQDMVSFRLWSSTTDEVTVL